VQVGDLRGLPGIFIFMLTKIFDWIFEQPDEYLNYQLGNTAVAFHGSRVLTLMEGGYPFEVRVTDSGAVQSVGVFDYDGDLKRAVTGHPKVDPLTGEMVTFFHKCASCRVASVTCGLLLSRYSAQGRHAVTSSVGSGVTLAIANVSRKLEMF
jgi:carotenoid cleavage dioxygenase-like enzyme